MIFLFLLLVSSAGSVDILGWAMGHLTSTQPQISREKFETSTTSGSHKLIDQETTGCVDVDKNCTQYANVNTFCKDDRYAGLMASRCAATCGLCCVDKSQKCKIWKGHGFCESEFYRAKRSLCPVTCGLCDISLNRRLIV